MPEVLSQSQIDALLQSMSMGGSAEPEDKGPQYKAYDFKSPKKFTREQLKMLDSLHENFSRKLSSFLSGMLRIFSEVEVMQIEEYQYMEYSNALPDSTLIGLLDLKPHDNRFDEGTMIMDVSPSIGFLMIDRLLGGSGDGYNLLREYTDIELAILTRMFEHMSTHLQDAWRSYIDVDLTLNGIETNARLLQTLAPEDIVVVVTFNITIKKLTGNISICIPGASLGEMIDSFSLKYGKTGKRLDADRESIRKQVILDSIYDSNLEIKAVLDQFQMDVNSVTQLQVDDVIPLDKPIDSAICLMVDGVPWFDAKLGETKVKKVVKICNLVQ